MSEQGEIYTNNKTTTKITKLDNFVVVDAVEELKYTTSESITDLNNQIDKINQHLNSQESTYAKILSTQCDMNQEILEIIKYNQICSTIVFEKINNIEYKIDKKFQFIKKLIYIGLGSTIFIGLANLVIKIINLILGG